jgi:hypothetical protein
VGNKCAAARNQSREQQQSDHQRTNPDSSDKNVEMPSQGAFGGPGLERVLQSKGKAHMLKQGATVAFEMATPFQFMFKSRGAKDTRQAEQPNPLTREQLATGRFCFLDG